jgi:hypothetical protein
LSKARPTGGVLDSQFVKAPMAAQRGYDTRTFGWMTPLSSPRPRL